MNTLIELTPELAVGPLEHSWGLLKPRKATKARPGGWEPFKYYTTPEAAFLGAQRVLLGQALKGSTEARKGLSGVAAILFEIQNSQVAILRALQEPVRPPQRGVDGQISDDSTPQSTGASARSESLVRGLSDSQN